MEGIDQIGFEVGWDHADYGVPVPETSMVGTLADGYKAGMEKRGRARAKEADRYVRKWLQLRRSAWRRERIFDPSVTPDFIRRIDVPFCPITRERLTHGTGQESDWSVDRVINDGGYVRGNLVVMSTRANKVKDAMTTKDIVDTATKYDEEVKAFYLYSDLLPGLSADETSRLYTLTMLPNAGSVMLPARVFMPPSVPCGRVYMFQCYLAMVALLGTVINRLKADLKRLEPGMGGLSKTVRRITDAGRAPLISQIDWDAEEPLSVEALVWTSEDIWMAGTGVYEELHKWLWTTPKPRIRFIMDEVEKLATGHLQTFSRLDSAEWTARLGIETSGYVK